MGGSVSAIEQGFIQDEIARSAYEYQRQIETGEKIIVGVNKFQVDKKQPFPVLKSMIRSGRYKLKNWNSYAITATMQNVINSSIAE